MKLSDVMSAAGLAVFAEAALVLFIIVFIAVCFSVFSKKNSSRLEAARYLPLGEAPDPGVSTPRPQVSSSHPTRKSSCPSRPQEREGLPS